MSEKTKMTNYIKAKSNNKKQKKYVYVCICMNLLGVAVPELDSHPDHNKGPDHAPCAGP